MKMGRRPSGSRRIGQVSIQICSLLTPCRRPILIATKYLLFRGQDTNIQTLLKPTVCLPLMRRCTRCGRHDEAHGFPFLRN
jgi:hypothetical protein